MSRVTQIGHNVLVLDCKGEMAMVGRETTSDRRREIYINPNELHEFPSHYVNPLDFLALGNPSLVADAKVSCLNAVGNTGSAIGDNICPWL